VVVPVLASFFSFHPSSLFVMVDESIFLFVCGKMQSEKFFPATMMANLFLSEVMAGGEFLSEVMAGCEFLSSANSIVRATSEMILQSGLIILSV